MDDKTLETLGAISAATVTPAIRIYYSGTTVTTVPTVFITLKY